jgi:putative transposase
MVQVGDLSTKRRYSMSDFRKLAHAVWRCKYHLVWCPKYRFRVLRGDVGRSARESIRSLCERAGIEILEGNVRPDHVHLVVSIPPKVAVSRTVGFLKGKSAISMFDRYPKLRKRYWGRHFWARGYCVSTVGLDEEEIRKYVRWQLKKDRKLEQFKIWD